MIACTIPPTPADETAVAQQSTGPAMDSRGVGFLVDGLTGRRKDWFLRVKRRSDMGELEGMCPACKEYTTAGDSCCGRGAIVEGSLITDEQVHEAQEQEALELATQIGKP